jgi:hypothetical protein
MLLKFLERFVESFSGAVGDKGSSENEFFVLFCSLAVRSCQLFATITDG